VPQLKQCVFYTLVIRFLLCDNTRLDYTFATTNICVIWVT